MIKIVKPDDVLKINDKAIIPYINNLISSILYSYCANRSIEAAGAIYFLEYSSDFNKYKEMGLSSPLCEKRFEWIEEIGNGYSDGCIVINNDFAINIIGKTEFFPKEVIL
ncbi:hypothetical protein RB5AMG_02078 [Ruminococcus bromii]|nr:hypothetical protein [Ruminococcus bromii]PKD27389.1 hypothetical protein RB5AMG_02078 [Ruminococcus bromii]DAP46838.1 MAG TPA: hypothetical protein [Caudoviricetes sp.]